MKRNLFFILLLPLFFISCNDKETSPKTIEITEEIPSDIPISKCDVYLDIDSQNPPMPVI